MLDSWTDFEMDTADAQDADAITALVQSAYRGDVSRQGWTTEADLLEGQRIGPGMVREELSDPNKVILLFRAGAGSVGEDGEAGTGAANGRRPLVACCQLERKNDSAYFGMFAVSPSRQGGGIGKNVLTGAEAFARQTWGATRISLSVINLRAELIAWYQRRGYELTGESEPFPYGDDRFGRPTTDELRFLMMTKSLAEGR
ncbi:GNAT family N-acetyltransferase [Saxibacter everestensis]|uniref:GNAT family N-acetyltransferase n=1 Tax=Saxibacter everestensis TaxID=2909229 RepID=A0ABY8QWQ0_9MICO|nr:GNAT family N-acetyltransferase [Brevibacteriaceae bacterium ZFBP1038]